MNKKKLNEIYQAKKGTSIGNKKLTKKPTNTKKKRIKAKSCCGK